MSWNVRVNIKRRRKERLKQAENLLSRVKGVNYYERFGYQKEEEKQGKEKETELKKQMKKKMYKA